MASDTATPTDAGKRSEEDSAQRAAQAGTSEQERLHEKLIFDQELSEVLLLVDFVSGRSDRNLSSLTLPNPHKDATYPTDTLAAAEVVKRISMMRYPPDQTTPVANAENAAVLLLAKDGLSHLAFPARGLTIAYTAMFVSLEGEVGVKSLFSGTPQRERDPRSQMATRAFPALERHAHRFVTWRKWLFFFWIIWLALTALTYWDVARGRSALQRLDQFWKDRTTTLQAHPELWNDKLCKWYSPADKSERPPEALVGVGADAAKLAPICDAFWYSDKSRDEARTDLDRVFQCQDMGWSKIIHIWCWTDLLAGAIAPVMPQLGQADGHTVNWQSATAILSVFTTYVLPMMFGLLGTLVGSFHSIQNKVCGGELAPRDLALTFLGLAMGVVAGFVVGLFLSPSDAPIQGAGGLAGNLTLTASGLGFLAGYGSQTFFRFVDELLKRVFPDSTATRAGATSGLAAGPINPAAPPSAGGAAGP